MFEAIVISLWLFNEIDPHYVVTSASHINWDYFVGVLHTQDGICPYKSVKTDAFERKPKDERFTYISYI
jgi:hypothetical protein